jgi:MYXO-CTERM domain-containing protein
VALALLLAFPAPPAAADDVVNRISLLADAYVNGSTAGAVAILNFTTGSPPDPGVVDAVNFTWRAPNGTAVYAESVDPDEFGFAITRYRPAEEGAWRVEAAYSGNLSVTANVSLRVHPAVWSGALLVEGNTEVSEDANLTILPGTLVRFAPQARLTVRGRIVAAGTAAAPITLTSNSSAPAPGDWRGLRVAATAAPGSILDNLTVAYSLEGLAVEAAVNITTSRFSWNVEGVRLSATNAAVGGCTFLDNTVGVHVLGGNATVARALAERNVQGVLIEGGRGHRVADSTLRLNTAAGVRLEGAGNATLANLTLEDNAVAVRAVDSSAVAGGVSVARGGTGWHASGLARLDLGNATIGDVTAEAILADGEARVTATATTFPTGDPLIAAAGNASVVLRNRLTVQAVRFEDGAPLPGVAVAVFDDGRLVSSSLTDPAGFTPAVWVTDRTYAPAPRQNATRIVLSLASYGFENNNVSSWDLGAPLHLVFRGSSADADADGSVDFLDPDDDNDGLPDATELAILSDPLNPDTDGDTLPDGWEFDRGRSPTDPLDAVQDTDGDGLRLVDEYANGTDPDRADTDFDRMPDGWEVAHGLAPLNASDAGEDPDGDGYTNLAEFASGSDPRNASSHPEPVGALRVLVTDADGALISGVLVRLSDGSAVTTGVEGLAVFEGLPERIYAVNATLAGYRVGLLTGVAVTAGTATNVTIVLQRGGAPDVGTAGPDPWLGPVIVAVLLLLVVLALLFRRRRKRILLDAMRGEYRERREAADKAEALKEQGEGVGKPPG